MRIRFAAIFVNMYFIVQNMHMLFTVFRFIILLKIHHTIYIIDLSYDLCYR